MTHSNIQHYTPLVARTLLVLLFIISGFGFITNFAGTVGYFTAMGIPLPALMLVLVIIVKFAGSLSIISGIHAREGAWALIGFTILATLIGHTGEGQMINALKNVSIIGGLLLVAVHGAGPISLKHKCPCPKCKAHRSMMAAGGACSCGTCEGCVKEKEVEIHIEG